MKVVLVVIGSALLVSCAPPPALPIEFTMTARPRVIDGRGKFSIIDVTAVDAAGKPGTGSVIVTSTAGSFIEPTNIKLTNGAGDADFICVTESEPLCAGSVRIDGKWSSDGQFIDSWLVVTIQPPSP